MVYYKPHRLKTWDYSNPWWYFVTICTNNKICNFGEAYKDSVSLSKAGRIAEQCWCDIPNHFPNIGIDEYVIMPNHVHGIIIINSPVVDRHACQLQTNLKYQTLPVVIGSYKSACSKLIRKIEPTFAWQPSFYDHVIRTEKSCDIIRQYILNNPLRWDVDRNVEDEIDI